MGYTLSLVRMYGYKLKAREWDDAEDDEIAEALRDDPEELIDRVTGTTGADYSVRSEARKALGVEFELYSWGDEMPYALAISESMATVYDDGIMPAEVPPTGDDWNGKLDRVASALGLKVDGEPRWYYLARYF